MKPAKLEDLKKNHFNWVEDNDFYTVNENNLTIKNDDKPVKLDFKYNSFFNNLAKIKYENICHTYDCDIKLIIPFKTFVKMTEKHNIDKVALKQIMTQYKKDLERDVILRKYFININNNLKEWDGRDNNNREDIKKLLRVSDEDMNNLSNDKDVKDLYKYIFNDEINETEKTEQIINILLLKKLYKFLFNDELDKKENKKICILNILTIMQQEYDAIYSNLFLLISDVKYTLSSVENNRVERSMFLKKDELILKTVIPVASINNTTDGATEICMDINQCKLLTVFTYIKFDEKLPNYYMKLSFNDMEKIVYRKNSLTYKEGEETKRKIFEENKIIFI